AGYIEIPPPAGTGVLGGTLLQSLNVNWQIGNGLMGLLPGLTGLPRRAYGTPAGQLRAFVFGVGGVVVGIGVAAFGELLFKAELTPLGALSPYFVPVALTNAINLGALVPVLLFNYARLDAGSLNFFRSGLLRQLALTVLVSAVVPLGVLGLLLVRDVQTEGRALELTVRLVVASVLTFAFSVANAALMAQSLSRPLLRLETAARAVESGRLSPAEATELQATAGDDELGQLVRVFGRMAGEVVEREQRLRREVAELQIQIDHDKKARQVAEITETDYFQSLQARAKELRQAIKDG
ncbi:MAG TPA: HAMP domain-containing protein, partial [Planctomycetaceae bacterium]